MSHKVVLSPENLDKLNLPHGKRALTNLHHINRIVVSTMPRHVL